MSLWDGVAAISIFMICMVIVVYLGVYYGFLAIPLTISEFKSRIINVLIVLVIPLTLAVYFKKGENSDD